MIKFGRPRKIGLTSRLFEGVSGAHARADHGHELDEDLRALLAQIGTAALIEETDAPAPEAAAPEPTPYQFSHTETLSLLTGLAPCDMNRPGLIRIVRASVGVAPVGADLICDVKVNAVSIFPDSPKPTIPAGATTSGMVLPDVRELNVEDRITVDITQIGSTTPGSWLTLTVEVDHS